MQIKRSHNQKQIETKSCSIFHLLEILHITSACERDIHQMRSRFFTLYWQQFCKYLHASRWNMKNGLYNFDIVDNAMDVMCGVLYAALFTSYTMKKETKRKHRNRIDMALNYGYTLSVCSFYVYSFAPFFCCFDAVCGWLLLCF